MTREEAIVEVVRRLVDHYRPERVYLFGSSARGDVKPSSDLDAASREKLFDGTVYRKLWGIPLAVAVIPFRHTAFEARSNWLMSLPSIALRECRLACDAALVPASGIA